MELILLSFVVLVCGWSGKGASLFKFLARIRAVSLGFMNQTSSERDDRTGVLCSRCMMLNDQTQQQQTKKKKKKVDLVFRSEKANEKTRGKLSGKVHWESRGK